MNAALDYLLKANLFLVLFYGCYWLWLRKHTFFRLNRLYLLASVLLSLVLPFIELPTETVETIPVPVMVFALPVTVTAPEPTGPDWETIGYWFYGAVAVVLLLRLLLQVTGIGRLIRRSERHAVDDYTLVLPSDERVPTFSFFRFLVLCRRDAQTSNTPIVAHELVHIRQWHSFDVLLLEVVQLMFWMNPVLILYKRSIQQVHEFLADAQAEDKHEYATFLVNYAFGIQPNTLTNGFFKPSLIKERILMLQRRATSRWALGKYILVLPLLLSLLAMTTAREEITQLVAPVIDEKITVSGKVTDTNGKPLAGATVVVLNGTNGFQTDAQGRYELKNVPTDARLVASYVGFESQTKAVSGNKTLDFTLTSSIKSLQPVVVVGYGVSPKPATTSATTPSNASGPVFTVVEQSPEYPGGMSALGQYLATNVRYPEEARQTHTQGTVFVQFTVDSQGDITGLRVKKGIGAGCDEEAVRVVSQMPRWKPGIQNGKPVMTQYVLPIQFQLEGKEDKRSGQVIQDNSSPANVIIRTPLSTDPNAKPLYIVDGKKLASTETLATTIGPNSIASINVLKGASATSIYGNEGQNGVIEVTSKQKVMGETIQTTTQPGFGSQAVDFVLDGKTITREEFQKLNPSSLERIEVDHTKTTYTIKATSKN
ncbi:M56 family metallopeptidase [Larkinella terrae]|uniref:TonB family protein n=1 Tax=Larkinella terrae TaxID=2025311 RepID=A0A7K0EHW2_9BACT|nr:M56 family metallopeptidase [Larkinella terrae]MRS61429.1 TonB family protein [Larkinella terrae]